LEHAVVVLQGARHARAHHDGELVEEAPPPVRVALDERKVLGGEEHRPHQPENGAHPLDGSPGDPGPVRTPRGDPDLERALACPPNWWRSAATAFIAGESSWREAKRANSAAEITGSGTAWSIASSTVQRPSPESATQSSMLASSGSASSASTSRSSSHDRTTV